MSDNIVSLRDPRADHKQPADDPLSSLVRAVTEQADGIRMLIDVVTQLDKRVRWLELQERQRSRVHAKLVDVNGREIG